MRQSFWSAVVTAAAAITALVGATSSAPSLGQERLSLGPDRAAFVLRGFIAGRGKLRSGNCDITAHRTNEDVGGDSRAETDIEKNMFFDFGGLLLRVEHREGLHSQEQLGGESFWTRDTIATPEFVAKTSGKKLVTINRPEEAVPDYWDPRVIGLASIDELERGVDLQAISERWRRLIESGSITAYGGARQDQVELLIESESDGLESRMSFFFDVARDYVPVSYEQRVRLRRDGGTWSPPVRRGSTTWQRLNDVYVPITSEAELNTILGDSQVTSRESLAISIEWREVNKPVDLKYFTAESLESEAGRARIFDTRTGRPVMVQHPQFDRKELARIEAARWADISRIPEPPERPRSSRYWLIALNAFIVLLVMAFFAWRRYGRWSSKGTTSR